MSHHAELDRGASPDQFSTTPRPGPRHPNHAGITATPSALCTPQAVLAKASEIYRASIGRYGDRTPAKIQRAEQYRAPAPRPVQPTAAGMWPIPAQLSARH